MISSNQGASGGRPIPFIEVGPDRSLSVTAEAMSTLEGHQNRKISVVTFCGPANTGKSYLCNRVMDLEYKKAGDAAFEVSSGSTEEPCTEGIMMWDRLIPLTGEQGEDLGIDLVVLDAEGLNSSRRGFDDDVKMFAVAVLLSSQIVYNQRGPITDQSLEDLSLIQMLTTEIKYRNLNEQGQEFHKFFPELLWALRDFQLDFKHLKADSYLEQCLEQERGHSDTILQQNSIRLALRKFFPTISCHPFVCPVADPSQAAHLSTLGKGHLNPSFIQSCEALRENIFRRPKSKEISGKHLTGFMLLGLSLDLIESFNKKEPPVVLQALERVVSIESDRYVEQLFEEMVAKIMEQFDFQKRENSQSTALSDKFFPDLEVVYTNKEMADFLEMLVAESDMLLGERLKGVLSVRNLVEVRNDFEQRLANYFDQNVREQNAAESRKYCHNLLEHIYLRYQPKIQAALTVKSPITDQPPDSIQQLVQLYNKVIVNYNLFAREDIPYRSEAIADFFQGTVLDELQTFFSEVDMANQMHFGKQKLIMEEQMRHNAKLENLLQASTDKLSYLRSQRAGHSAERETL